MYDSRGSIWRKWDLHFHTPSSFDYVDKSITNEEIVKKVVESRIEVVVVTDHHVIDTERILKLNKLGKNKVAFLPGIELRAELGGKSSVHFIGIFPGLEKQNLETLWTKLQGRLDITPDDVKQRGDENIYHDFKDTAQVIHELGGLVSVHAGTKSNSFEMIGNAHSFKQALKRDLAYECIDIFEVGKKEDIDAYKNIVFPSIGKEFPLVICSDNHDINSYENSDFTWIEADPTFEGLKQITFEPNHRTHISENKPNEPLIKLNKVAFDLPFKAELDRQPYCITGKYEFQFHPSYTCIIGGRGTGKSSILNLIEHYTTGDNDFFNEHSLTDENNQSLDIIQVVEIDEKSEKSELEFISQNEIEEFAKDYFRFTEAIFNRIEKLDRQDTLKECSEKLLQELNEIDNQVELIEKLSVINDELDNLKTKKERYQNILASLQDEVYKQKSSELSSKNKRLNRFKRSRVKLLEIIQQISDLILKVEGEYDDSIPYEKDLKTIHDELNEVLEKISFEESDESAKEETAGLEQEMEALTTEINEFLEEKGLSEENLKEAATAQSQLDDITDIISQKEKQLNEIKSRVEKFEFDSTKRISYEDKIREQIEPLNSKLQSVYNQNGHVKKISLEYEFDEHEAKYSVFRKVYEKINNTYPDTSVRRDYLDNKLFEIPPNEIENHKHFIQSFDDSETGKILKDYFSDENNFKIYLLLIEKAFNNIGLFKKINVYYDNRPIGNSSFGQRCTAALIILLLLGNNPIIIDEPEAHLDSSLIADNLVELIKSVKPQRQIIFATHNANFVINGDAGLIYVLEVDDNNRMKVTPTTIENLDNREHLYALEGGEEAFKQRENRYAF